MHNTARQRWIFILVSAYCVAIYALFTDITEFTSINKLFIGMFFWRSDINPLFLQGFIHVFLAKGHLI